MRLILNDAVVSDPCESRQSENKQHDDGSERFIKMNWVYDGVQTPVRYRHYGFEELGVSLEAGRRSWVGIRRSAHCEAVEGVAVQGPVSCR